MSSRPPRKKPTPFSAFLEPVRIATQRNSVSDRHRGTTSLTALLELIFVRSFAIPESAWAAITYATISHDWGAKASIERATSWVESPPIERRLEAEASRDEAADEVRDDPEDLVEEKQRGDLERRVAEVVEVVEDEDAERAVGDRVGPVGAGDDRVVAEIAAAGVRTRCPVRRPAASAALEAPGRRFRPGRRGGSHTPTRCRTTRRPSPGCRRRPSSRGRRRSPSGGRSRSRRSRAAAPRSRECRRAARRPPRGGGR